MSVPDAQPPASGSTSSRPAAASLPVLVAAPHRDIRSETFIRAHIELLPTRVHVLSGLPLRMDDRGRDLLFPQSLFGRAMQEFRKRRGITVEQQQAVVLTRHMSRLGVKVVLAEYGQTAAEMVAACKRSGIPLVAHFHGYDAYRKDMLAANADGYRLLFRSAARVVAVSDHMVEQLRRLGCPAERIVVIRCGVAPTFRVEADPASNPPHFVSVGRFTDKKAPHLTLLAFEQVLAECPDASLAMIGDGPLLGACRSLVEARGLQHAVQLTGVLPPEEISRRMQRARGFLQHSITACDGDSEGTPVAVQEASLAGLPVVATRHGGISEVIEHERTGLLVEEKDVKGFAAAIARLAANPALATRLGTAGRQRAEREFTQERAIGKLWAVLREAAEERGEPR